MENTEIERIIASAQGKALSVVGETSPRLVYLGDGDGNILVENPLNPREVFYRTSLNENERGIATLHPSSGIPLDQIEDFQDEECILAYPANSKEPHIMRQADTGLRKTGGFTPNELKMNTAGQPSVERITTFYVMATSPGSLFVQVIADPPLLYTDGLTQRYFFSQTLDLTSLQAALAAGEHRIALAALNPYTGLLEAIAGDIATADNTPPSRAEFTQTDIETLAAMYHYPAGVVYLYYGQDSDGILDADIYRNLDPRMLFTPGRSHEAGKVTSTATDYQVLVSDELVEVTDTSAPRVITLPPLADCWNETNDTGYEFIIKDSDGLAGTNNITVQTAGLYETIDGSTSSLISANYGAKIFRAGRTEWLCIALTNGAGGAPVTTVTASSPLASSGGTTPNISINSSTGTGAVVLASSPTVATPIFTGNITQLIGGFNGIIQHANSADRTYTLPNATGTVALTSDITAATALAVILAPGTSARNKIQGTTDVIPLTVKGFSTNPTTYFEAQNSAGTALIDLKDGATTGGVRFEMATSVSGVPVVIASGGQTFGSTFDRMLIIGNNVDVNSTRINTSYSANFYQFEADYENTVSGAGTKHWTECNYNVINPAGTKTRRMFQFVADMDDPDALAFVNISVSPAGYGSSNGTFQIVSIVDQTVFYDMKFNGTFSISTTAPIIRLSQTGTSNGQKWMRSNGGNWEVLNDAFSAVLLRVSNSGTTTIFPAASTNGLAVRTNATSTGVNVVEIQNSSAAVLYAFGGKTSIASATSATLRDFYAKAQTITITGTTQITTATGFNLIEIETPTYTDSSAVTIDQGATVYIAGAPIAAGSVTLTNPYALWVDANTSRFDGNVEARTLTSGRVTFAGTNGLLSDSAGLTYATASGLTILQATLGNVVQTLSSVATNDDPTELVYQNRVTTTDATVTTLHTFTVPASTTYAVEVIVVARRTGGSSGTAEDGARYKLSGVYKNVTGTATIIGVVTALVDEDQAGWDATLDATGATVRVRVTGASNNNVVWHATARVYPVGT